MLPRNPNATHEAKALLAELYNWQGKVCLSGQHNQMARMSVVSERVKEISGHYPKVWGGEWGFSDGRHDTDNIAYRPKFISEVRRHHAMGSIIVVTYHQADPTVGEPCAFDPGVIGNLSEAAWDELLSVGSDLNNVWAAHIDRLAEALKEFQAEGIPIIFRPYHEMNGTWFWWGGDPARFKALWNLIYDRYVNHHGLNNLLWAWNPDKPWPGVEEFFPGHETVDLLGTDIYPRAGEETYPQEWFERMSALAAGKPLALSENSEIPRPGTFQSQPWSYWMAWDELIFKDNTDDQIRAAMTHPNVRNL